MLRKLRMNRPAPTRATVANATSAITRRLRVRCEAAPAVSLRLPSLRTSFRLERNTNMAGESPRSKRPARKPRPYTQECGRSVRMGVDRESDARHHAEQRPLHPQQHQQAHTGACGGQHQRLCEHLYGDAQRPAPSAQRIPNSLCRPTARASRRLATLAQTISSTTNENANRIPSGARSNSLTPLCCSQVGRIVAPTARLVIGLAAARLAASAIASARACAIGTPRGACRSRPTCRDRRGR